MQLAMFRKVTVGTHGDVRVVQRAVFRFHEAGQDGDVVFPCDVDETIRGGTAGNGLGQFGDSGTREGLQKGIAGDAAFVEGDDFGARIDSPPC